MGEIIQFPGKKRQRSIYTAIVEQAIAQRQAQPEPVANNVTALITVQELIDLLEPTSE